MTRSPLVSWLVLVAAVGCGEPSAPATPLEVVQEALEAIRAEDGERLLSLVQSPPGRPHRSADFRAVEETLRQLGRVDLQPVAPEEHPTADSRVCVVPVTLSPARRDAGRVAAGLTLVRQGGAWQITERSLRALLIQATDVATGTSRSERKTRVMLEALSQSVRVYATDHENTLPNALDDLLTEQFPGEPYVSAIPRDGWGNPLHFVPHPDGSFDLRSPGPDGVLDTDDDLAPGK